MNPVEFNRPQVHWKNDNLLLGKKILHTVELWLEIKKNTHIHNLSDHITLQH